MNIKEQLYKILVPLRNWDNEYAKCIIAILRTEENMKKLLSLIQNGLTNSDTIILKAIAIRDKKYNSYPDKIDF